MPPNRREESSDESHRIKRLELLETLAEHLGGGAVLLGPEGGVELRTRQIDRLETIFGEGWYRPCLRPSDEAKELNLTDELHKRHRFEISRLSLFRQDDVVLIQEVAESKWVEGRLEESESPLSLFLDHLPAAVFIKDGQSRILYVNEYVRANFGAGHSRGGDPCEHLAADVEKKVARDDRRALSEGRRDLVERLKDRTGRERTFRTLRFPIHQPSERPSLLGCIAWDISDALAASESLTRSKRRYREIFEIAEEGIWLVDAEADTLEVNQRMAQMLGYGIDEMRVRCLLDFMDEQAIEEAKVLLDRCRKGISDKYDLRFRTKAGDELWTMVSSAPRYDELGSYAGVLMMVTDITERKRAEVELKRERDFAESLIETAPVIVLVLDPEGMILRFNSFMEKLSGYSLAEVMGKSWLETFLPEREISSATRDFEKVKKGAQAHGNTRPILTRDGKERLIAWYDMTLRDDAGDLRAVLTIGHDVTEQKAKEAQLVQAQKMETVGQLTGGIAHDFNNLLTVILGNLELLSRSIRQDSDSELFDLVQDSLSAAQDGAELTKRLLAFARKAPLKRKRIDLPAFLSNFQRFLRRTLGSGVAISVDVEADLDFLLCDPHQLENALLNLALNARDAMSEGGRIRIRARSKQAADLDPSLEPGRYAELSVMDTGSGMTSEQLSRAIEPFYTTKGTKQGTGLGLSMVYGFCEQAGGIFLLATEPGEGTRATIVLPFDDINVEEVEPMLESKQRTFAGKGTVLVAEDDERVRKLAGRYLRDLGYEVLMAEDGERAIEVLLSEPAIELVFSDLVMLGEVNGDDLYLWVKTHRPEVEVLLTTGLRSSEIAKLAQDTAFPVPIGLPKPYTKEQLAEAIRDVFAR